MRIIVTINGNAVELTVEEARALWELLGKAFNPGIVQPLITPSQPTLIPVYPGYWPYPYTYPGIGTQPWVPPVGPSIC